MRRRKQAKEGDEPVVNQHHLKLLKKGVDVWNAWKIRHPEKYPHLPQVILPQAKLSGTDLSFANLYQAVLSKAQLSGTILSFANLGGADLSDADLSWARL